MRNRKRMQGILALLLALVMVIGIVPFSVATTEATAEIGALRAPITLSGTGGARWNAGGDPRPNGTSPFSVYPACQTVGNFCNGSWIRYDNVDLGDGLGSFRVRYLGGGSGNFEIRLGDPANRPAGAAALEASTLVGSVARGAGGGLPWSGVGAGRWTELAQTAPVIGGVRDVYIVFNTNDTNFGTLELTPAQTNTRTLFGRAQAGTPAADYGWGSDHRPWPFGGGDYIGGFGNGTWIRWHDVDLGAGILDFYVTFFGPGGYAGFFDLRVGDPDNRPAGFDGAREIATAVRQAPGSGGWSGSANTAVVTVDPGDTWGGVADVYLRFRTNNTNFRRLTLTTLEGTWVPPEPPPSPTELTLSGLGNAFFRATPPHDGMYIGGGGTVGSISGDGSWIRFNDIDLLGGIRTFEVIYAGVGTNMRHFDIVVAPAEHRITGTLIPAGNENFRLIGTASNNENTGGWNENYPSAPVTHTVSGQPIAGGVQDVYLVFRGGNANFITLDLRLVPGIWTPPVEIGPALPYAETIERPAQVDEYLEDAFLLLRHDRPARLNFANNNQTFNDTTHIGNGRMGANLFGGVVSNVISINEHTVWAGGPGANPNYNNVLSGVFPHNTRHNFTSTPYITHQRLQSIRERLDAEVAAYATGGIRFCDPANGVPCYPAGFPIGAQTDVSNCPGGVHVVSEFPVALQSQDGPWPGGGSPGNRHNPLRGQVVRDIETQLSGGRANFGSYMELGRINLLDPEMPRPMLPPPPAQNIETNQIGSPGEHPPNIFLDNDSKWFTGSAPSAGNPHWVSWTFGEPYSFNAFTIATANDMPDRDPATWRLLGRNSATDTWSVIHNQTTMMMPTARNASVVVELPGEVTYTYFRFEVFTTRGPGGFQISRLLLGQGTPPSAPPENTAFTLGSYDRSLFLETGLARVEYTRTAGDNAGIDFTREYFMNHPQNVFGMRMTGSERFDQLIRVVTPQPNVEIYVPNQNILRLVGQPADHLPLEDAALHFVMEVMVVPIRDGEVANDAITIVGNMLNVEDVDEIILLAVAGTNYYQDLTHDFNFFIHRDEAFDAVRGRLLAAAELGYNQLLANHVEDHMNLFGRVDFQLEGMPEEAPTEPTEQIVWGYNHAVDAPRPGAGGSPGRRAGDRGAWPGDGPNPFTDPMNPNAGLTAERRAELDRYLEVLMFQFGRYLLIGSSRDGGLPANLQGIWAVGLNPPWEADYHTNVNVQMNYWPAEVTNLMETHIPFMDYIRAQVPRGEIVAQHYHMRPLNRGGEFGVGARGWVAYHVNNIWGHTVPESFWEAFYAPSGGAWMALAIWENYLFNRDTARLLEFWDTLYGAAIFWEDNLWIDSTGTAGDRLVTNPSYSPEHGPYSLGCTSDQALVYEIFNAALGAAAALDAAGLGGNITPEQRYGLGQIAESLQDLGQPRIGEAGYFQEWRHESQMDRLGLQNPFPTSGPHRHINHLFAIHPGTWVVPERSEQDDAFTEAIRVSLGGGRTDGTTGWSRGWTLNIRARLLEGNYAFRTYQGLLLNQKLPNLLGTHEPFQIDGNFGATAGVAEMFIQSHADVIRLLPAIPRDGAWSDGHMIGLRARGNVTVDQFWSEGGLDTAVLHVGTAGELVVHYPNISESVLINASGAPVAFEIVDENVNRISFPASAGGVYTFVFGEVIAEEVNITNAPAVLRRNTSVTLGATVMPAHAPQDVIWSSNNPALATVNAQGVVTARVATGIVVITARTPDGQAVASVTIRLSM